jgi:hypothetical protein
MSVRLPACIGAAPTGWIYKFDKAHFYKKFLEKNQILLPSIKNTG